MDSAGFFAAEGTAFHEWAADCLEFGLEPEDLYGAVFVVKADLIYDDDGELVAGRKDYTFTMDQEFGRHMRAGLARVRELANGATLFVEVKVDISPWTLPGHFGTSDVIIVDLKRKTLTVFDWKYGAGHAVSPVENDQLRLYVLGAWRTIAEAIFAAAGIDPSEITVRVIIEQPRAPGGGGEWMTTMAALLAWGEGVKEAASATSDPLAPRTPGLEQCHFCKAKGSCGPLADYLLAQARLAFDELDDAMEVDYAPPLPAADRDLTPEERAFIHRNAGLFTSWLEAIRVSLIQDFMHDRPTPGIKMVMGNRGKRAYKPGSEETVRALLEAELGEEAFEKKLISPSAAEKKLSIKGYAELSKHVRQSDGKPTLVNASDVRPAIQKLADKFADLTDEDEEENE